MTYKTFKSVYDGTHRLCKLPKAYFYQKYIDEGMSLARFSRELGCSWNTLKALLTKHDIPVRNNSQSKMGNKNHIWKGGETIDKDGYVLVRMPHHPQANNNGYIRRSRLVMEKYLERPLDLCEVVHHKSDDIQDDRIENLTLFDGQSEHVYFHWGEDDVIKKG